MIAAAPTGIVQDPNLVKDAVAKLLDEPLCLLQMPQPLTEAGYNDDDIEALFPKLLQALQEMMIKRQKKAISLLKRSKDRKEKQTNTRDCKRETYSRKLFKAVRRQYR